MRNLLANALIVVFLFVPSIVWAILGFSAGFQDSLGAPTNRDLDGQMFVFFNSLTPLVLSTLLLVRYRQRRGVLTACAVLLGAISLLWSLEGLDDYGTVCIFVTFLVFAACQLTWDWLRPVA